MISKRTAGLGCLADVVFIALCGGYAISCISKADVIAELTPHANTGLSVHLNYARVSRSHGLYVQYEITGHAELIGAYWRLWPFRQVDVTK
ncbi:MAG: hypothetical protein H7Y88_01135 [Phycisphaerales bacterium]|nr:hypothetical protein [Phycisphaerales bacterium]